MLVFLCYNFYVIYLLVSEIAEEGLLMTGPGSRLTGIRSSLAFILAAAVARMRSDVRFGFGAATETGFYCDFDPGDNLFSESDLKKLEAEMAALIRSGTLQETIWSLDQALDWAQSSGQKYKQSVLDDLKKSGLAGLDGISREAIGIVDDSDDDLRFKAVSLGDFTDLRQSLSAIKDLSGVAFRLLTIGGVYWRRQADQPQLQRIAGTAFLESSELDDYMKKQAEAWSYDHRFLGPKHQLFMISDIVGSGLPLFLPKGAFIKRQLEDFAVDAETAAGYQHVSTPDIAQLGLYEKSGHYPYYKDSMYSPIQVDDKKFMIRPMACPHHFQIYNHRPHSYKEMPVRLAEIIKFYRYEQSGELSGLTRMRAMTLTDAHIICRRDQVADVIDEVLGLIEQMNAVLGIIKGRDYRYRLSRGLPGSKIYHDDPDAWRTAEDIFRQVFKKRGEDFTEAEDEAAFYGPKIDIQMDYRSGQEETLFTVQYDFLMPKRFGLSYVNRDNKPEEAVVIHRSSIGCIERLMGMLIEIYECNFPFWLSPHQLRLIPVNDSESVTRVVGEIKEMALKGRLQVDVADSSDSLSRRIRQTKIDKVASWIVVGDQEVATGQFALEVRPDLIVGSESSKLSPLGAAAIIDLLVANRRQRNIGFKIDGQ